MRSQDSESLQRRARYETFEERLALSADPVGSVVPLAGPELEQHYGEQTDAEITPDFALDVSESKLEQHTGLEAQSLNSAHQLTGVDYVHNMYGFAGAGQTVAIIDSGIAYDHVALGGGYGANHRVVGGYDFAENDSDPYDDGPAGFHGTHVAGIVGSDDNVHRGVASEADLVALRVFDDSGNGYFGWVESALSWVHEHRNDFENPITTVNLSLGTDWNADSVPNWAMLEDEFAQLEADGIFVAVSAGNSFQAYGSAGLSYPAASEFVVPVASVDDNGTMSDFSQRNDRVLAAPGRSISSTVPDHVYGSDGNPNDFGSASGTSMAAPYVAGVSTLVREAMDFVGYENITQDAIYSHLRATADMVFDAVTNASYHRVNVESALQALMPDDDYGSTIATAFDMGTLAGDATLSGLIGTTTDHDVFRFTAGNTGEVSFTFDVTHDLQLSLDGIEGGTWSGNTYTLDVVEGQDYTLSLGTDDGIGFYDLSVSLEAAAESSDGNSDTESGAGEAANDEQQQRGNNGGQSEASKLIAQKAYDLDHARGLNFAGDEFLNWGGRNEKWVVGHDGWYFILSDGEVYKWNRTAGADGDLVAKLDGSYYDDLSKLYDAEPPSAAADEGASGEDGTSADEGARADEGNDAGNADAGNSNTGDGEATASKDELARELDDKHDFRFNGSYYEDWAGLGEKWMASDDGWFFITEDGGLYRWNGSKTDAADSERIAQLDASYHADPSKLTDPPAAEADQGTSDTDAGNAENGNTGGGESDQGDGSQSDQGETGQGDQHSGQAAQLDQELGLRFNGSYYEDWAGLGEKWMASSSGAWYFLTDDGSLHRWNGSQSNAAASEKVATLDGSYHADPSKLHEAATGTQSATAAQVTPAADLQEPTTAAQPNDAASWLAANRPLADTLASPSFRTSSAVASVVEDMGDATLQWNRTAALEAMYSQQSDAVMQCLAEMRELADDTDDLEALDRVFDSLGEDDDALPGMDE